MLPSSPHRTVQKTGPVTEAKFLLFVWFMYDPNHLILRVYKCDRNWDFWFCRIESSERWDQRNTGKGDRLVDRADE